MIITTGRGFYNMDMDSMLLDQMLEEDDKRIKKQNKIEHRRGVVRKSQAKRRLKARQNGLCPQCCKKPVIPGRSLCRGCLERQREVQKRYMHKHKKKRTI